MRSVLGSNNFAKLDLPLPSEAVVVMDSDLQDPPELIPELLAKWKRGVDVVHAQRVERKGESFSRRHPQYFFIDPLIGCLTPRFLKMWEISA